jgi:hypothetical protein
MSAEIEQLLEKYNIDDIFVPLMEHYNPASIRGGSFVVINKEALADPDISKDLKIRRGPEFVKNLEVLANSGQTLFVSALKIVKPSSAYMAETAPNNFEEADIVVQKVPGLYNSPMTVPTSILKTVVAPNDIYGHPIPDEFSQKTKIEKGRTLDNEYNKGKQPKGTRTNGGNN